MKIFEKFKNGSSGVLLSLHPVKIRSFCRKTKMWRPIFEFKFLTIFFAIFGRTDFVKNNCQNTNLLYRFVAQHIQKSSKLETKKSFRRFWDTVTTVTLTKKHSPWRKIPLMSGKFHCWPEISVADRKFPLLTEISVADRKFPPQGLKHVLQYQQRKFPLVVIENYVKKLFPISFSNSVLKKKEKWKGDNILMWKLFLEIKGNGTFSIRV